MANKLWGGRFEQAQEAALFSFLSSENAGLDCELAAYDIDGSIAHVAMLARQKILTKEEAKEILLALFTIKASEAAGKFQIDPKLEDVHTNVEAAVTKITAHGKKMHTARSRNDQVCLDTRLYMRDAINALSGDILALQRSLSALSENDCVFPTYTHTQVAQPASLSFWAHCHYHALERDLSRLNDLYARVNQNPLGSGAVAGTTWHIDRVYVSRLLGFSSPTENPMDTVSNRGEMEVALLSALYLALSHCSRIAEDIILLSNKRLCILPDEYSTGSSMMPQKKNPDPLELVRGKCSRMLGLYVHAASLLKGVPSGYNLDSQESKYALLQGVKAAHESFSILSKIVPLLKFNPEKISLELEEGFACATELADLLSKKGVPFRKSHEITGGIVRDCIAKKKFLSSLSAKEVSELAGVLISPAELSEAVSVDKVARFAAAYKIPSVSAYSKKLALRKRTLGDAQKLLEKEARSLL
ncbi:MAG: argininosuccinate lyase [Candidatus Micrarchaeia archaeon]